MLITKEPWGNPGLFFCGSSTELVGSSGAELRHNPLSFHLKTRLLRARARARERERTRKGLQYYCWFIHPRTYISADEPRAENSCLLALFIRYVERARVHVFGYVHVHEQVHVNGPISSKSTH